MLEDRSDIRIAKKWLAHFHALHTENPVDPEKIAHKVGRDGKVTFSLGGGTLLDPAFISLPESFRIRTGRGDKELVIEKKSPRGIVAVMSMDGTNLQTHDPGFLTRFLLQLKIHDRKDQ